MEASALFLLGLGITGVIAASVGGYLRSPLRQLLAEQNGGQRVEFWRAYFTVVMVLVPLAFAMLSQAESGIPVSAVLAVAQPVRWGLLGLALSLLVAGRVLRRKAEPSIRAGGHNQNSLPGSR
jgi:hypothetical protein